MTDKDHVRLDSEIGKPGDFTTEALLASRSELSRRDSSATETPAYVLPDEPEVIGLGEEESDSAVELGVAWRSVGLGSGWKEK